MHSVSEVKIREVGVRLKVKLADLMFRAWFYFRLGYGTYLDFIVGFVTFVASTYYLAIQNLPFLEDIFVHFHVFVIVSMAVIAPLSVLIGWFVGQPRQRKIVATREE